MSLNLLVFGVPLYSAVRTLAAFLPQKYQEEEKCKESSHSQRVKEIVQGFLSNHSEKAGPLQEKVREFLEQFFEEDQRNEIDRAEAFLSERLKVIAAPNTDHGPVFATGTYIDSDPLKGKLFIGVAQDTPEESQKALNWIVAHEFCHLLHFDHLENRSYKTIFSFAVTVLCTLGLGWGFLASTCASVFGNIAAQAFLSHRIENRADDFANQYCTKDDLQNALAYFQWSKESQSEQSMYQRFHALVYHPSVDTRIAKINQTILNKPQNGATV